MDQTEWIALAMVAAAFVFLVVRWIRKKKGGGCCAKKKCGSSE